VKKYCVAYANLFDNELIQKVVDATDKLDAVIVAGHATQEEKRNWSNVQEMEDYFFNGDSLISVIKL
jgi:hypothetical protein